MQRWLRSSGAARGEVIPLAQVWKLAEAWYGDPRSPTWTPRTRDESQAVLSSVGLTGDFWELPPG